MASRELGPGDAAHVAVGRRHRFEAIERVELVEVSTPELGDVVRVEDDFGREGTSQPVDSRPGAMTDRDQPIRRAAVPARLGSASSSGSSRSSSWRRATARRRRAVRRAVLGGVRRAAPVAAGSPSTGRGGGRRTAAATSRRRPGDRRSVAVAARHPVHRRRLPATAYDPAKFGFAAKGLRGEVMAFVTTSQVDDALASARLRRRRRRSSFFSLVAGATARSSTTRAGGPGIGRRSTSSSSGPTRRGHEGRDLRSPGSRGRRARPRPRRRCSAARTPAPGSPQDVADEVVRRGVDGVNVDFEPIPRGQKANFTRPRPADPGRARRPAVRLPADVRRRRPFRELRRRRARSRRAAPTRSISWATTTPGRSRRSPMGPRRSAARATRSPTRSAGLRKVARPWQLIVGVPYYGHLWPTVSGALNARTTGGGYDVPVRERARLAGGTAARPSIPSRQVQRSAWRGRACATCPLQLVPALLRRRPLARREVDRVPAPGPARDGRLDDRVRGRLGRAHGRPPEGLARRRLRRSLGTGRRRSGVTRSVTRPEVVSGDDRPAAGVYGDATTATHRSGARPDTAAS